MLAQIGQLAWTRWTIIGDAFGDFQARLFAVVFYFTIFAPFALIARLSNDPLHLRTPDTTWIERNPVGSSLEDAKRQF